MSKEKMLAAKVLIQEKRYVEARKILEAIDDPIAKAWLAKLDKIAPPKSNGTLIVAALAGVGIVVVCVVAVILLKRPSEPSVTSIAAIPTLGLLPTNQPTLLSLLTNIPYPI